MRPGFSTFGGFNRGNTRMLPPGIKALLIANGVVFLFQLIGEPAMTSVLGLRPADIWTRGFIWQLGTYMFLHGGLFHILFNLFALWMFGRNLENVWGTRAFVKYFLVTGIGAGIITTITPFNFNNVIIGASGAVLAVLFAYARTWPNNPIYIYFLFPVPAKYFVAFMILIDLLAIAGRPQSGNVAHITHLGGVLIGWLYLLKSEGRLFSFSGKWRRRQQQKRRSRLIRKREQDQDFMAEVDRVLDRINEVGYDGLTDKEKEILNRASAKLSETD